MKPSCVWALLFVAVASPAFGGSVEDQVIAKEKSLWSAWQKHDGDAFRRAVTTDSVQIITGTDPVVGREPIVKSMTDPDCTLRTFELGDMQAHRLSADVILLSYRATQDGGCGSEALQPKVQSTAIYVRRKGQWLERYYQETPAK